MTIETKFGVGDKCCVVEHNQIINGTIESIDIAVYKDKKVDVFYSVSLVGGLTTTKRQKETFVSINNALEYLKDNAIK